MEIKGEIFLFFEQSGTFKNEFKKLGYSAYDYDIQNEFNQTDFVMDLFSEIDNAYNGLPSLFDTITKDDLIIAFYPCIYFCEINQQFFCGNVTDYKKLLDTQKLESILDRSKKRQEFYERLFRFVIICKQKNLRMIFENPYSPNTYLYNNFIPPAIVDKNRMERGDYFVKPTAYWFINCVPSFGFTHQNDKKQKIIRKCKSSKITGICSTEKSMISSDYARNWICDFILGKIQNDIDNQFVF